MIIVDWWLTGGRWCMATDDSTIHEEEEEEEEHGGISTFVVLELAEEKDVTADRNINQCWVGYLGAPEW